MVDYRREPTTVVVDVSRTGSRRFWAGFLVTFLGLAALMLAASVYANPYGYFGRTGQLAVFNERQSKSEYLLSLDPAALPDAWIVGSSNMMTFQVTTVNRLFGVNAFNLGSFWSRAEDEWAWVNLILNDLRQQPKLVILGVEPWTFADDSRGPPLLPQYQRRLLNTPVLRKYLDDAPDWKFAAASVLDGLTLDNLRTLVRGFAHFGLSRTTHGPFWMQGFNKDGTNAAYSTLTPAPFLPDDVTAAYRGMVSAPDAVQRIDVLDAERRALVDAGYIRLNAVVNFLPGDRMLDTRMALFQRTVALLHEHRVPVAIVMLPVHPYYHDVLLANTQHAAHVIELRRFVESLKNQYDNVKTIYDASHIARFGGDPAAFLDTYHMTPPNTDRVLAALCRQWCGTP